MACYSWKSDFADVSHHSLTCIISLFASALLPFLLLGLLSFPSFELSLLLLLPFWLYDPTSLSLWLPSSFHLHPTPFTLSLSYDYFLLPHICIFLSLTTLTTRTSPSSSLRVPFMEIVLMRARYGGVLLTVPAPANPGT